ncbi:MAG TPA: methionine biosynthesis protein MetW [Allocoleopsis sp.]
MKTNYISHDIAYQRLKAAGAFGWTSEADHQVVRSRVLEILKQQSLRPGSRVLDLGCGAGDLAIWLAQQGYESLVVQHQPNEAN